MLEFTPLQRVLFTAACRKDGTEIAQLLISEAATAFQTIRWSTSHVALLDLYSEQMAQQSEPGRLQKQRPQIAAQALFGSSLTESLRLHSYRNTSVHSECSEIMSGTANHVLSIEYSAPWKSTQRMVFLLESSQPIETRDLGRRASELGLPFFYASLLLFDVIDTATLRNWFRLMGCLSPAQLNVMREIVSSPRHELSSRNYS